MAGGFEPFKTPKNLSDKLSAPYNPLPFTINELLFQIFELYKKFSIDALLFRNTTFFDRLQKHNS